jgi:hypothetical protein
MSADSRALHNGVRALASYADFIALAIITVVLGLAPGVGAGCSFERLAKFTATVEAASQVSDYGSALRAGTGGLCR